MAGKLYMPVKAPTVPNLALRFGVVLAALMVLTVIVHLEGGLVDKDTGERPSLFGCLYFVVVTVTTVGYGDIVPVGTMSRLTDIVLLTPVRLLVIFTFVGTAYQVIIQRFREEYRMKRAVEKLHDHVLVCGFGNTGRVAAQELLLQGTPADQIVVLDTDESVLADAADLGLIAIHGDPSREHVLPGKPTPCTQYKARASATNGPLRLRTDPRPHPLRGVFKPAGDKRPRSRISTACGYRLTDCLSTDTLAWSETTELWDVPTNMWVRRSARVEFDGRARGQSRRLNR